MGTQRNIVGSLFICAVLYNFGLTLLFGGVITGVFYSVSACNAHKVWIIHVYSYSLRIHYITMQQQYFPQKFITRIDLDSLLHSFPSCPAVSCSGLPFSDLPDKRDASITDRLRHDRTFKLLPTRTVKFSQLVYTALLMQL